MDEQITYSAFDLDLMKRAMEPTAYEMSKKPRYGMTNGTPSTTSSGGAKSASVAASFENYGYGGTGPPMNSGGGTSSSSNSSHNALYSTTPVNAMTTPNSAPATTAAPPSPYVNYNGMMGVPMNAMTMNMGGMNMLAANAAAAAGGMNMFNAMGGFGYSPQLAAFPQSAGMPGSFGHQQQQPHQPPNSAMTAMSSPAMSNFGAQSHYNPAVAAAAAAAANNATGRTVYIGSLPPSASVDELLNLVHFGPLESIRVLPSKSCVFLSFLDGATAAAFHADATIRKLALHGQELKIGWGKASPVPAPVLMAISQSAASRNVYLGGLDEGMTEEQLRDDLSRFGLIDQVKIVRDKNIGFVHFLSIATATKVVATLPTEPAWAGKRVNYGKDRCAYIPKSQQAAAAAAQVAAAQSLVAQTYGMQAISPATATFGEIGNPANPSAANLSVMAQAAVSATSMNRTIYLGNIHPETTTEDLCNAVRGGVLQSIRYMQDKHICFVTFVDPAAAFGFFQATSYGGLTINGRRVKIGWGKNSGPLTPQIAMAVHGGATRNVYVGNISEDEWDNFSEERLRADFSEFGEIELVNYLKEKNCAFVNFTTIANAMKAIENIKARPDYANLRISHGKDRCANPPRLPTSGGGMSSGTRRNNSNNANAGSASQPASAVPAGGEMEMEDDDALDSAAEAEIHALQTPLEGGESQQQQTETEEVERQIKTEEQDQQARARVDELVEP